MTTRRWVSKKSFLSNGTVVIMGGAADSFPQKEKRILASDTGSDETNQEGTTSVHVSGVVRTGAGLLDEIRLTKSQTVKTDLDTDDNKLNA